MTTLHSMVGDATTTDRTKEAPDVWKLCASSLFHLEIQIQIKNRLWEANMYILIQKIDS